MKKEELVKKLKEASKKLEKSSDEYIVDEQLSPGRGVGNFRFEFHAKKKKTGLFGTIANIAKSAIYYGTSGVAWAIADEIAQRKLEAYTEPIHKEMSAQELSALFDRWVETIPKGFIETIGNIITLPDNDKFINAKINVGKEISITMDFVRIKGAEVEEAEPITAPKNMGPVQPEVISPVQASTGPVIPMGMPLPVFPPGVDLSSLYVKGSLKNVKNGFQFAIRNPGGEVIITSPFRVVVDGKIRTEVKILTSKGWISNSTISKRNPLKVSMGETLVFKVEGEQLSEGMHKIDVGVPINGQELMISNVDNI